MILPLMRAVMEAYWNMVTQVDAVQLQHHVQILNLAVKIMSFPQVALK